MRVSLHRITVCTSTHLPLGTSDNRHVPLRVAAFLPGFLILFPSSRRLPVVYTCCLLMTNVFVVCSSSWKILLFCLPDALWEKTPWWTCCDTAASGPGVYRREVMMSCRSAMCLDEVNICSEFQMNPGGQQHFPPIIPSPVMKERQGLSTPWSDGFLVCSEASAKHRRLLLSSCPRYRENTATRP